jgi:hypothetical protein
VPWSAQLPKGSAPKVQRGISLDNTEETDPRRGAAAALVQQPHRSATREQVASCPVEEKKKIKFSLGFPSEDGEYRDELSNSEEDIDSEGGGFRGARRLDGGPQQATT